MPAAASRGRAETGSACIGLLLGVCMCARRIHGAYIAPCVCVRAQCNQSIREGLAPLLICRTICYLDTTEPAAVIVACCSQFMQTEVCGGVDSLQSGAQGPGD